MKRRPTISPLISRRARPNLLLAFPSMMIICTERLWSSVLGNAHSVAGRESASNAEAQETCRLRNQASGYVRNAMGRKSAPGAVGLVPSSGRNLGNGQLRIATIESPQPVAETAMSGPLDRASNLGSTLPSIGWRLLFQHRQLQPPFSPCCEALGRSKLVSDFPPSLLSERY
jgi:hypothetical protein